MIQTTRRPGRRRDELAHQVIISVTARCGETDFGRPQQPLSALRDAMCSPWLPFIGCV
jgi:hypothetical protein